MKNSLILAGALTASLFAQSSFAVEVRGARLNASKTAILVDIFYGAGCFEHKFELQIGACRESYPVSCAAELVDTTHDDNCERYMEVNDTISLRLSDYGLNDAYYSGGNLTIYGQDSETRASVRLP